jgi:hypothetical protein
MGSGGMVLFVLTVPGVSLGKLLQLRTHCRHNVFAVAPLHIKEGEIDLKYCKNYAA